METIVGRVYKLVDKREPLVALYVGSTETPLHNRWCCHRVDSKRYSSKVNKYLSKHGVDNFELVLLEQDTFDNTPSLRAREEHYRVLLNPPLNSDVCYTGLCPKNLREYKNQYNKVWGSKKIVCDCGTQIRKDCRKRHSETDKHSKRVLYGFMRTGLSRAAFLLRTSSKSDKIVVV